MIETLFSFTCSDDKVIERILEDDNAAINHMILRKGEALPEHHANSNVYMIVVRGLVSLRLDGQEEHTYPQGSILCIPHQTKMNVLNPHDETLELFVVKAPSPKTLTNTRYTIK